MTNKSKRIGREGENAVAGRLRERGAFPDAEPRVLYGINDKGDITGTRGVVFQVKSGKSAEQASNNQLKQWLADAEKQRENAGGELAVLVVKRAACGIKRVGMWRAFATVGTVRELLDVNQCYCGTDFPEELSDEMIEITFDAMITLLQYGGYAYSPLSSFNQ